MLTQSFKGVKFGDLPGDPAVKNPPSNAGYSGFFLGQEIDPTCPRASKPVATRKPVRHKERTTSQN